MNSYPRRSSVVLISALVLGVSLGGCGGGDGGNTSTAAAGTTVTANADVDNVNLSKAGARELTGTGWSVPTTRSGSAAARSSTGSTRRSVGRPASSGSRAGRALVSPAYAFGALFAATCYADEGLVRIDPDKLEVTGSVHLPTPDLYNQEGSIAAGEGAVWVIIDGQGCEACVLAGFDPTTLSRTYEIGVDPGAASVAVGNGFI